MGRNSPRISDGASGFISYMSIWLGPPPRQIMMTDFSRFAGETDPSARRRKNSGRVKPPRASAPVFKKLRRDSPSQKRPGLPLKKVSMPIPASLKVEFPRRCAKSSAIAAQRRDERFASARQKAAGTLALQHAKFGRELPN